MMSEKEFNCYLCGHNKKENVIVIDSFSVSRCVNCGLGFLETSGITSRTDAEYGQDFYITNKMIKDPEKAIKDCLPKVKFIKKLKKSGNLLDIGCGLGYFAAAAKREGFAAYGIEGSEWAIAYIRRQFAIAAYLGPLEKCELPQISFDVCTMWQVIEHVDEPLMLLKKVRELLSPGGYLVIETRNYRGIDARMLGERWNGWSLPYHLWHFDPGSLRRMVNRSGFTVVEIKLNYSAYVKNKIRKVPVLKLLRNPISSLFAGSNITVIAKKT